MLLALDAGNNVVLASLKATISSRPPVTQGSFAIRKHVSVVSETGAIPLVGKPVLLTRASGKPGLLEVSLKRSLPAECALLRMLLALNAGSTTFAVGMVEGDSGYLTGWIAVLTSQKFLQVRTAAGKLETAIAAGVHYA